MKIRRYQLRRLALALLVVELVCIVEVIRVLGLSAGAVWAVLIGTGAGIVGVVMLLPLGLWLHDRLWGDEPNDGAIELFPRRRSKRH